MEQFTLHSDPGHTWLEVPRTLLKEVGVEKNITGFSYQRGDKIYLEENSDLPVFIKALTDKGRSYTIATTKHYDGEAKIRNYARFKPEPVKKPMFVQMAIML